MLTIIACWFNRERQDNHSIWVCGDSKISLNNSTLLESGAKIFSIPLLCFGAGSSGFFDQIVYRTNIGLAYAGSSLVGLNVSAALSTCLSRLNVITGLPSLDDIAEFAARLVRLYVSQLSVSSGAGAMCEISLVGFCPIAQGFKIYHMYPRLGQTSFEYVSDSYSNRDTQDDFVLLLGADKERIMNQIHASRRGDRNITWWRAPKSVLGVEVAAPQHPTIGGNIQLGICIQQGFDVYSLFLPHQQGVPTGYLSYLGFNMSEGIGTIGGCHIGMPGMT